jgi:hypothetical protein
MTTEAKWRIAEPCDGLVLRAEETGVWVRSLAESFSDAHRLRSYPAKSRLGRLLPTLTLQLIEMGLASLQSGGILIEYREFARLEQVHKIDAFDGVAPWAPFTIELETSRWPGDASFCYFIRLYAGRQIIEPERRGCFVRYRDEHYCPVVEFSYRRNCL